VGRDVDTLAGKKIDGVGRPLCLDFKAGADAADVGKMSAADLSRDFLDYARLHQQACT